MLYFYFIKTSTNKMENELSEEEVLYSLGVFFT